MISSASASISTTGTGILVYSTNADPPNTTKSFSITYPAVNISSYSSFIYGSLGSVSTDNTMSFDKAVGFYVSYFFDKDGTRSYSYIGDLSSSSAYSAIYYNSANTQGSVIGGPSVSTFTPASSRTTSSTGYTLKCQFEGSPEYPINRIAITTDYSNNYVDTSGVNYLNITSASIVEVASSAELEGLQNIANQIVAQNDILNAMYGDIMEVLNAIYSRLGDMQATMNLANSYFNSMVNYLNSINTNTANIYSLLQSQFQLLIATINTASSDIQGAISKQTEDLKTYFDSVFNSAVGTLPDDTDSAQGVIDDAHENDEQYTADALGKFEEISATFQGFNGSVGSGVAVASTLFSRVWTAMGDYVIVYTFPLTLALALVIVGRLSRVHSKDSSKSKGGDDSG